MLNLDFSLHQHVSFLQAFLGLAEVLMTELYKQSNIIKVVALLNSP